MADTSNDRIYDLVDIYIQIKTHFTTSFKRLDQLIASYQI